MPPVTQTLPILSGIWTDSAAEMRIGYPVNLMPVAVSSGLSEGYLRPADGTVTMGTGPGVSRGGILWNGTLYRVMGSSLVSIARDGTVTTLGDVGTGGQVRFDYGYNELAVVAGGDLYYWSASGGLVKVSKGGGIGSLLDVVWMEGFYVVTDGAYFYNTLVATPTTISTVNRYQSISDPGAPTAVRKLRNELYAVNRYVTEVMQNTGSTTSFSCSAIPGAVILKGAVSMSACCNFADSVAFVGGGRGEAPGVYLVQTGAAQKVSTREIDIVLRSLTESQLASCLLESRVDKGSHQLWVHLPDRTAVYDLEASSVAGAAVWFYLTSATDGFSAYRIKDLVWAYDAWQCADTSSATFGYLTDTLGTQWGTAYRWEFSSPIVFADSRAVVFYQIELFALTGRIAVGVTPTIGMQSSQGGMTWTQVRTINAGTTGDRMKNLVWLHTGWARNWRIHRFVGTADAFITFAKLLATVEVLEA